MLYTRKGDDGNTKLLCTPPGEKVSKSSCQTESLGALDELNSFLGLVKVKSADSKWTVSGKSPEEIIFRLQNLLFIIQAEVAGADKKMTDESIKELESYIDAIEKELPPIMTFFVSGGTELAALFDISRTIARRVERRVIAAREEKSIKISDAAMSFLNRISSVLYALARFANFKGGVKEQVPDYNA